MIWNLIAILEIQYLEYNPQSTWYRYFNLLNSDSSLKKYIVSFYFITVTLTTVGYGDISPENEIECFFAVSFMLSSGIVYAYGINQIGIILNQIYQDQFLCNQDLEAISTYMQTEQVSSALKIKIINYLKYLHIRNKVTLRQRQQEVFGKLTETLKNELKEDIFTKYMQNIDIITQQFSEATVHKLVSNMEQINFGNGDIIFRVKKQILIQKLRITSFKFLKEKDQYDLSLYYIVVGEVQVAYGKNKKNLLGKTTLHQKQYFGQYSFFTDKPREYTAISIGHTKLVYLTRQKFLKVIYESKIDKQIFCESRDDVLMENVDLMDIKRYTLHKNELKNQSQQPKHNPKQFTWKQQLTQSIGKLYEKNPNIGEDTTQSIASSYKCHSCNSNKHNTQNCHRTHYVCIRNSLLSRFNKQIDQTRKIYSRANVTMNSLGQISIICKEAIEINQDARYVDKIEEICLNIYPNSSEEEEDIFMGEEFEDINDQQQNEENSQKSSLSESTLVSVHASQNNVPLQQGINKQISLKTSLIKEVDNEEDEFDKSSSIALLNQKSYENKDLIDSQFNCVKENSQPDFENNSDVQHIKQHLEPGNKST